MTVDRGLLSEFIKATNDTKETKDTQLYGTVISQGDSKYVMIDGSDIVTPVKTTTDIKDNERVVVNIKGHIATVTGNLSNPSAGGDRVTNAEDKINVFDDLFAGNITADNIAANTITTDKLVANSITADKIAANSITTDKLVANSITADKIEANAITSKHIQSNTITSNHIAANTITADNIATGTITAGSGIIAEGAIGSAQISSLDVAKLEAGTIDTSRINISGADGHLRIKGNRLQVFDGLGNKAIERVSVGDVNGDGSKFGLRVRGSDGETVIFDEKGVTSEGITDGSITNEKISDDANIDGVKLNINSVINQINDAGTEIIKGTKISIDGTNLEAKLYTIETTQNDQGENISHNTSKISANEKAIALKVDSQTYTTDKEKMTTQLNKNTSSIEALQGEIKLKVEQTDITNAINNMSSNVDTKINSAKSEIKMTTDSITQNVSKLSQTVSTKADSSTVTTLSNKIGSLEVSNQSINSKVSSIESTTKTINNNITSMNSRLSSAEQKITSSAIVSTVQSSSLITDINGKISSNTSSISKLEQTTNSISSQVANKVDSKTVSSIIKQSSSEIQVGFNGINNRISINPTSFDLRATNNNRDMSLYGGQVCIYNNINDTFMATMGSVLKSDTSYKGVGFLLGKNANIFTVGRDVTWTDIMLNRSPNPTHYLALNFDTKQADIDMELNTNNINMRKHNLRNATAIGTDKLQTNMWYNLANSPLFTYNTTHDHVDMYKNLEANYKSILNAKLVNPLSSFSLIEKCSGDIMVDDPHVLMANEDITEISHDGEVTYDLNEMIQLLYKKIIDQEKEINILKEELKNIKNTL